MKSFAYISAGSVKAAVAHLADRSLALAGGTDILNLMKDRIVEPDTLVNLKNIDELDGIAPAAASTRIGANVTLAEILANDRLSSDYPALHEALVDVGTPQIRNMSTLGGNLCARPRCWYYRTQNTDCLKRGDSTCGAIEGDNERHSIFATNEKCVMVQPSSAAPPLIAYGAKVRITGNNGEREIPLERFYTLPSVDLSRESILAADDVLTHVILPPCSGRSATYEVRHKESHDWPLALVSVVLELDGTRVTASHVWLGAVAPVPWRATAAEAALAGKVVTEEVAAEAAERAVAAARPLSGNRYKVTLTRTAVKRAILAAATGRRI